MGPLLPMHGSGRAASSRRVNDRRPDCVYDFQMIFVVVVVSKSSLLTADKRGIPLLAKPVAHARHCPSGTDNRDDAEPAAQVVSSGRTGKRATRTRCHYFIISAALLL